MSKACPLSILSCIWNKRYSTKCAIWRMLCCTFTYYHLVTTLFWAVGRQNKRIEIRAIRTFWVNKILAILRLVLENDDKCWKHALLAYYREFEIKDTPQSAPFDVCYVALLHIITLLQHYFGLCRKKKKQTHRNSCHAHFLSE